MGNNEIIFQDSDSEIHEFVDFSLNLTTGNTIVVVYNSDNINVQDNTDEIYDFIEIINKGVTCIDPVGDMVIVKEPNPKQVINVEYEVVSNKVTGFTNANNTTYPTSLAVYDLVLNNSGDKYFRYVQNLPAKIWSINHNLNKRPSIVVTDSAGTTVEGMINYVDINNLIITFNSAFSGYAELN